MSPCELAARALGVDSNAISSVEQIKHGLTNESWLVKVIDDAVVVRVSNQHWASLQIDRIAESLVLDTVARAGIGPEIVAMDIRKGVLVTRYLGATCTEAQMTQPDLIERLGRSFRALHSLPALPGVREVHLPTLIAGYLETLETLGRTSDLIATETRHRALMLASQIADTCEPMLCHNDVHHLNLIDADPLRLIDWEYAGLGEPYFDLASVCMYHDYTMQQRAQLLAAYSGSASAMQVERLGKCCWLFEYVRELWSEVRGQIEKN